MIKYAPILIIAVFADLLQLTLSLSFLGAGTLTSMAIGWIPFVGPALAGTITGAGIALGIVINFCLAMIIGSAILIFLLYARLFYLPLLLFGGAELLPVINNIPGWTGLVIFSIIRKYKQEKTKKAQDTEEETTTEENVAEEEPLPEVPAPRMQDDVMSPPRIRQENYAQ